MPNPGKDPQDVTTACVIPQTLAVLCPNQAKFTRTIPFSEHAAQMLCPITARGELCHSACDGSLRLKSALRLSVAVR